MGAFEVSRSQTIQADPARVHALINDFHRWPEWSPWEGVDPGMERTYAGSETGVGSHYAWSGNRKAGSGSMEITGSTPERIDLDLEFLKPFKATNELRFTLTPQGGGTRVDWHMSGTNAGLAGVVTKVFKMDRLVGKDFEKGLARLKAVAEAGP